METERKRTFIIQVAYYLLLAAMLGLLFEYVMPMLLPFVLAFVIAYLLRRPTRYISRKGSLPYRPVALLMVLLFYATIGFLIVLMILRAFSGIQALVEFIPHAYEVHLLPALGNLFFNVEGIVSQMDASLLDLILGFEDQIMGYLGGMISNVSGWTVGTASGLAASIPALFIKVVLMVISTFFIAMDYDRLTGFCMRQLGERSCQVVAQIKAYLIGTLFVCIRSYLIIMSLTFVELSIGLTIIGMEHAVLIAGLVAVFDILPVLGTGGIMVPWSVITLLHGDTSTALALLLLYVVITVIRNIVEPKIVGSQLGLHPVVTLASMFAGVQIMGMVGLFGFPIALSLLCYLNENGTIHLFKTGKEAAASDAAR